MKVSTFIVGLPDTEAVQQTLLVSPFRDHFYVEFQVHLGDIQKSQKFFASRGSNLFDHLSPPTDHDFLLAGPFHDDSGRDVNEALLAAALVEHFHLHGSRVGKLFAGVLENLFTDDFGNQEALRLIRQVVIGQCPSLLRDPLDDVGDQGIDVVASLGRYGNHCFIDPFPVVSFNDRKDAAFVDQIDLVQDQQPGLGSRTHRLQCKEFPLSKGLRYVNHMDQDVDFQKRLIDDFHHALVEKEARAVDSRRVDENNLGRVFDPYSQDSVARGLGLVTDNRDLLTNEKVEKRGFAGIGAANQSNVTRFLLGGVVEIGYRIYQSEYLVVKRRFDTRSGSAGLKLADPVPHEPRDLVFRKQVTLSLSTESVQTENLIVT